MSMLLVGLHVKVYRQISPLDEAAHYDYLTKVMSGELLRRGERIGQEALRVASCRGPDLPGLVLPPCMAGVYDPDEFPDRGYNYLHEHLPAYYLITSIPTRAFLALGFSSTLDAARLTGGLWLGLGLIVFWFVAVGLGIGVTQRLVLLVLMAMTPAMLHASATVNDDATSMVAGSLLILAALKWERRIWGSWPLVLAGILAVALKPTNILGVGAVCLYLLGRGIKASSSRDHPRPTRREYVGSGAAVLAGGFGVLLVWLPIHEAIALSSIDPQAASFRVPSLTFGDVAGQVPAFVTPILAPLLGPLTGVELVRVMMLMLHTGLIATSFGAAMLLGRLQRAYSLAVAGAVAALVGGVGLTLGSYLLRSGIYIPLLPHRYALTLLPFLALGLGAAMKRRVPLWAGGVLAVVSAVATTGALLDAL
ncbi:MAG: hypothetical protein ACRDHV_04420 [Actinomycetota bacterium]